MTATKTPTEPAGGTATLGDILEKAVVSASRAARPLYETLHRVPLRQPEKDWFEPMAKEMAATICPPNESVSAEEWLVTCMETMVTRMAVSASLRGDLAPAQRALTLLRSMEVLWPVTINRARAERADAQPDAKSA